MLMRIVAARAGIKQNLGLCAGRLLINGGGDIMPQRLSDMGRSAKSAAIPAYFCLNFRFGAGGFGDDNLKIMLQFRNDIVNLLMPAKPALVMGVAIF